MYSLSSGATAQALGAPPWLDSPEYTRWFASHTEWQKHVTMGGVSQVAYDLPDGVWTPTVGVEGGVVTAPPAPQQPQSQVREPVLAVQYLPIATETVSAPGLPPLPIPDTKPVVTTLGTCTEQTYGS